MRHVAPVLISAVPALAAPVTWTDWTSRTVGDSGSVAGTLAGRPVTYQGDVTSATQTDSGTDYWTPSTPYLSATVSNAPQAPDIISLDSAGIVNTITFGAPVSNPVMALVSLGRSSSPVLYTFVDADFTVLSSGTGIFGGASTGSLFRDAPGVLRGLEGHGTIQFLGTFTSISWTASAAEYWHGFQVGVPEPAACPADFNGDRQADFFDYLDFAAAFDAESSAADFNGDAQVDFFDYLDFVSAFDAGC